MDTEAGQEDESCREFASLSFLRVFERGPRGSLRGTVEYFKHAGGPYMLGEKWPCAP